MLSRATEANIASQQNLNQHMATLREQVSQLHNDWQVSRTEMIQEHTEGLSRLDEQYADARQRLDEQYYNNRMRLTSQSDLDQAAELDQLRREHLDFRHEAAVIQMDREHWTELECLDQEYVEHMDTFQEQIEFLLEQLSSMVEMQTAGRNRIARREIVL
jgi:exonuclease VII large subunit